jgi:Bifunctional DNA primase/polymerase, N-terminal/Primase C terminal 1 (PriCT-1)
LTHTVLDFAMEYSRLGLAVLPLHYPVRHQDGMTCSCGRANCNSPAKHPVGHLVPNGLKNATTDHDVVERWFRNQPWNVAIVTGKMSGIFGLDVDPRHGGDNSIAALEIKNGPLPPTWRFLTGGGGEHFLFRHPGGLVPNSAGKLGVGIDVRGEFGYIVGPPSQHISGRAYTISVDHHPDDIPLADPPGWLIESVKADVAVGASAKEWRSRIGSAIPEGQRNVTLARISGHLLANGIDPHVCLDIILSLNATHCTPTLPEHEILNIVASITRREFAQRATRRKELNRG